MKLPHVRFCVNNECNFKCTYCRFGGESNENTGHLLSKNEIRTILSVLNDIGFKSVRFSGGEPLLRDDIVDILNISKKIGFNDTELVTNGFYINKYAKEISKLGIDLLTISLDAADRNTFSEITKLDAFGDVVGGIGNAHELKIPLRINMVLMKHNYHELEKMMDIASKHNAELKLLDLLSFQTSEKYWKSNFVSLDMAENDLLEQSVKKETVIPEGGYGVPMTRYHLKNGLNVLVKNSLSGAFYGKICNTCKFYPCQDGFYGLRITHDGKLKPCWPRNDLSVDILKDVKNRNTAGIKKSFCEIVDIFSSSKFHKNEWKKVFDKKR